MSVPSTRCAGGSQYFHPEIRRRRSVRDFSPRPVPQDISEQALRAAGTAPSGANIQPWHFVVVTDPELKRRIRGGAEEEERTFYHGRAPREWLDALAPLGTDKHTPFPEVAPCVIAVFALRSPAPRPTVDPI
jgi:iodotyrosine deiodinase